MLAITLSLLVTTIALLWAYLNVTTRHMRKLAEKIPGPKPSPLWKKIFNGRTGPKDIFQAVIHLSRKYGSTFCIWQGGQLLVYVQDIKHIAALLSDSEEVDRASTYRCCRPWMGSSLSIAEGDNWRVRRKLIAPEFRPSTLESSVMILNSNTANLINRLATSVDGSEVDVLPFMKLHAVDNMFETFMGAKVNAQEGCEAEYVRALCMASDCVFSRNKNPLLYNDLLFRLSSLGRLQARSLSTMHAKSNKVVAQRKQVLLNNGTRDQIPILDMLLELTSSGRIPKGVDSQEEINTILIAGYETTAVGLSFVCWMLSKHQDIQEKVLMEQKEIFGDSDRSLTTRDIHSMEYLEMVIKETFRLYPPLPIIGRKLKKDFDVGDFIIPRGANLMFVIYQIHRNPSYFPDPERFDPDRFLPDNVLGRSTYSYIPFSAGPRNCVGLKYGMQTLKGTISAIIRRFKILPGNTPLQLDYKITLRSLTGMKIRLESR